MTQHFLLSSAARTLSLKTVMRMSEEEARQAFQKIRWHDRKDRRLVYNQSGKRRVVVIMRERGGNVLPFVFKSEVEAIETIQSRVTPGSTIHADEATGWDALHAR